MNRFRLTSFIILLAIIPLNACVRFSFPGQTSQPNPVNPLVGTIVAQTLTAYPSPTIPVTITETPTVPPRTPGEFIHWYFNNINARNYTLTWSRLSDSFKNLLYQSASDRYQAYIDFWNSVKQANVLAVNSVCQGDLCAVDVSLQLFYNNGKSNTSTYPYTLTFDHSRDTWLFDYIPTPTATLVRSVTATRTRTRTPTQTRTPTKTPTPTKSPTTTRTETPTATRTRTPTGTPSKTETRSMTPTASYTRTLTASQTYTKTASPSRTASETASLTPTSSATPTFTWTPTETPTPTFTIVPTETETPTFTHTPTESDTPSATPTETPTT